MVDAILRLSLRSRSKGGDVQEVREQDVKALKGASPLLLLVHGYNVNEEDADKSYDEFERIQRESLSPPSRNYARDFRVVRVYWPADADWGPLSFLFFMEAISHAKRAGECLADALEQVAASSSLTVDVVAHSLGCRMVLEAIQSLKADSHVRFRGLVFFAAAVATFKLECDRKQPLADEYTRHVRAGALVGAKSLYSEADYVLRIAFPVGETLSPGHEGFLPTALGHAYWDSAHVLPNLLQTDNVNAGHSDYWGWEAKTQESCKTRASREARDFLRFVSAAERSSAKSVLPARQLAEARSTPTRYPQSATSQLGTA